MIKIPHNLTPPPVLVCGNTGTIRPETRDGDAYYGLARGTNGSAAITRRALAESTAGVMPINGWRTSAGRDTGSVWLVPTGDSERINADPWSGKP